MAITDKLIDFFRLQPEDDEGYDEYVASQSKEKTKKAEGRNATLSDAPAAKKPAQTMTKTSLDERPQRTGKINDSTSVHVENRGSGKALTMERADGNKVIPIKTMHQGLEVCIMKPKNFEDSQDICDVLLAGRAAVINLEGYDIELSQRIMDFISGAVYAINGKLYQISGFIFIVTPESVDITGDYDEIAKSCFFEVPTLSKEY